MPITNGNSIYNGAGVLKSRSVYKGLYKEGGLVLPPYTLRFKANRAVSLSDFRSTLPITLMIVDDARHIYDVKLEQSDWGDLFRAESGSNTWLTEVVAANTSGVTKMGYAFYGCANLVSVSLFDTLAITDMHNMFQNCTSLVYVPKFNTEKVNNMVAMLLSCSSLKSVPLFNTSSIMNIDYMLNGCRKVESGALALYTQMSTQANPPTSYANAFANCGVDTKSGLAELRQIPASWGGLEGALAIGAYNDGGIIFDDGSGTETDTNENF